MIASLEGPSLLTNDKRVVIQIMCADGNTFEMPVVEGLSVSNFMGQVKANGCVGTDNWFVVYDAILWAVRVVYTGQSVVSTEGMARN